MRPLHEIAQDVHAHALSWGPGVCLLGNVRADEVAYLAEYAMAAELERNVKQEAPRSTSPMRQGGE